MELREALDIVAFADTFSKDDDVLKVAQEFLDTTQPKQTLAHLLLHYVLRTQQLTVALSRLNRGEALSPEDALSAQIKKSITLEITKRELELAMNSTDLAKELAIVRSEIIRLASTKLQPLITMIQGAKKYRGLS
ncbi:MAG TPA: hypothetical protein VLJ21_01865 [Candidatus Binatia bacterium]|nr:hypothetical protein [Candidatus Binatia bacterium]